MYTQLIIIGDNVKERQYFTENLLPTTTFIQLGHKSTRTELETKLSSP